LGLVFDNNSYLKISQVIKIVAGFVRMKFIRTLMVFLLCLSGIAQAQFLPANKVPAPPLTKEILSRWITTNKSIHDYQKLIDEMLPTDAEAKAFEQLSNVEQDRIVNKYLQTKGMFEPLNSNMIKLGWTGVADYMRVSTQIGNAIAAYLQVGILAKLPPAQAKAMLEKTDPAVKSVTKGDLAFITANMDTIRQHIQGYSNIQ
jgi:hypothetical protein